MQNSLATTLSMPPIAPQLRSQSAGICMYRRICEMS